MSPITTHILDTALGRPAADVEAVLERSDGDSFVEIARGKTNSDGRIKEWWDGSGFAAGLYQVRFGLRRYFESIGCQSYFYPEVTIRFEVSDAAAHYHVPLLISPFAYSTYRGS